SKVNELKWDCRKVRSLIRSPDYVDDLVRLVDQTVETREIDERRSPEHFFEVELVGVVRHRNDLLLNPITLEEYLSEVAPVPFSPEFKYGEEITAALHRHFQPGNLEIRLNDSIDPVYRPHRNTIRLSGDRHDPFVGLELLNVP